MLESQGPYFTSKIASSARRRIRRVIDCVHSYTLYNALCELYCGLADDGVGAAEKTDLSDPNTSNPMMIKAATSLEFSRRRLPLYRASHCRGPRNGIENSRDIRDPAPTIGSPRRKRRNKFMKKPGLERGLGYSVNMAPPWANAGTSSGVRRATPSSSWMTRTPARMSSWVTVIGEM